MLLPNPQEFGFVSCILTFSTEKKYKAAFTRSICLKEFGKKNYVIMKKKYLKQSEIISSTHFTYFFIFVEGSFR